MTNRPLIGLIGDYEPDHGSFTIKSSYVEAIRLLGGAPAIIAPDSAVPKDWSGDRDEFLALADLQTELIDRLDGVLFTGGADVDPHFFGEGVHTCCGGLEPWRDALEIKLVRYCLEKDIPSLGICRGIQTMAAALGAKLVQDVYAEESKTGQIHRQKAPTWYPTHQVFTEEGTLLRSILGESCWVNTFHHQCISKNQEHPFKVSAYSDDGLIEGMEVPEKAFFLGVQWHPERMTNDPVQRRLFTAFIEAAAAYRN
ncbi:MAG: gamma-glutamyl-gamma-aminobutyrate hydrolase family protein [Lachnospiraceae bacterium]|nr:gamma-glutamyl-gamma-aminobutyrate hydrolase family protein [Lachnospiraceae bacterium]